MTVNLWRVNITRRPEEKEIRQTSMELPSKKTSTMEKSSKKRSAVMMLHVHLFRSK